ncbi:16S rRNA pseudouridine(516) synthase [Vibrio sp. 10N.286.49.B3]|uniref:pseudouridine synthase n=1 Tax=Vibrio sp. 10N.286.49.B3 TaxID=1880855 RepID=UPI000C841C7E|nr:pseudouridine synthase [Vibrio sp. 10N.286.49.B3]PMH44565.1 16S rRNA pseudouridine(516) synthase [Vibrio sp. 10N.286.49.B3]
MRLDKFICKSTELTKAMALEVIHAGNVSVNGDISLNERMQVHANNSVMLQDKALKLRPFRYLLMHKPAGTICSNIDEVYPSLFNDIAIEKRDELHIAGRLDADTTGLVLITDDGHWSYNITLPSKNCSKVYRVGLARPIDESAIEQFKVGVKLQGETQLTLPAKLAIISDKDVYLTLTEGKFHQVKRMFAAIGNRVISLHREKIGDITLDVDVGQWRFLTQEEVNTFL